MRSSYLAIVFAVFGALIATTFADELDERGAVNETKVEGDSALRDFFIPIEASIDQ